MSVTREELSQGLVYVSNALHQMEHIISRLINLKGEVSALEDELDYSGVKGASKAIWMTIYATLAAFFLFMALLQGSFGLIVVFAIFMLIAYKKRGQKSILKKIANFFIFTFLFVELIAFIESLNVFTLIPTILFVGIVILVEYAIITKKNKEIREKNADITLRNGDIIQRAQVLEREYNQLKSELLYHTSSWYPRDYYSIDAVGFFINALNNYRADTIKELVNLYESTKPHEEMKAIQLQIQSGQRKIQGQLRYANMLNDLTYYKLGSINYSIRQNTNTMSNINENLKKHTNTIENIFHRRW